MKKKGGMYLQLDMPKRIPHDSQQRGTVENDMNH
jgi:hypothetical protein